MECGLCGKRYKRPHSYNRHVAMCRLASTARSDDLGDAPSYAELYRMVVGLQREQQALSKEVKALRAVTRSRKPISYIDWLDANRSPAATLETWADGLSWGEAEFETMTSCGNFGRSLALVASDREASAPFVGFDGRPGVLYAYSRDGWAECSDEEIGSVIGSVFRELRRLLGVWEQTNSKLLHRDEFDRQYAERVKRVMGPSVGHQELCRVFRRALYDAAKLTLRNIIEYEFTA
jgi:hypothetical protein